MKTVCPTSGIRSTFAEDTRKATLYYSRALRGIFRTLFLHLRFTFSGTISTNSLFQPRQHILLKLTVLNSIFPEVFQIASETRRRGEKNETDQSKRNFRVWESVFSVGSPPIVCVRATRKYLQHKMAFLMNMIKPKSMSLL